MFEKIHIWQNPSKYHPLSVWNPKYDVVCIYRWIFQSEYWGDEATRMIQSGDVVDVSYQTLWAYEPAKMGI